MEMRIARRTFSPRLSATVQTQIAEPFSIPPLAWTLGSHVGVRLADMGQTHAKITRDNQDIDVALGATT
jgi:hypothetical protein